MDEWSRVISAGVGPIIVISACGLLCLAFYNRLAAVVTRLRAFDRERLVEQESLARQTKSPSPDELAMIRHRELIGMLEVQTRHVIRRAHFIRRTLGCLLLTIICLALCSLSLGLSTLLTNLSKLLTIAAATLFVAGLLLLVTGVIFAMIEMRYALDPVELESRFVRDVVEQFGQAER
jgi:hypothetical protein